MRLIGFVKESGQKLTMNTKQIKANLVTNVVPLIYDLFDKFYFLIRRVRPPEKMQRNRELTAARRKEENVMISQLTSVIPLSDEQLRKADRTTLIRLAVHFIKVKELVSSKWH